MSVLTFTSVDGLGNVIATANVIIDQIFIIGVQDMLWHLDPNQAKDLFDSSVSSGWGDGNISGDNVLHMYLGTRGTSIQQFADLQNVMAPPDDDGVMVNNPSGIGWLFLGRRLPSGQINWAFS
jgi:hypothetical protein